MITEELRRRLRVFGGGDGRVVVLTGAGISAESGIPTFRGPEGYWTIGSSNFHPQEMATWSMFSRQPREVWRWYLYRTGVCRAAEPNAGHRALVALERALGDRFTLITQNVDGLHGRAGQGLARTFHIHGNLEQVRCADDCSDTLRPVPDGVAGLARDEPLEDAAWARLLCPDCGGRLRPHVLWFDETYDERWYRWDSTLRAAQQADLLLVVGTAGATTLPNHVVDIVAGRAKPIVDVNVTDNRFARLAAASSGGAALVGSAGELLPQLVEALVGT